MTDDATLPPALTAALDQCRAELRDLVDKTRAHRKVCTVTNAEVCIGTEAMMQVAAAGPAVRFVLLILTLIDLADGQEGP